MAQHRAFAHLIPALLAASAVAQPTMLAAQGPPACRTYSAAETRAFSTGGGASQICDFNTSTNVYTCTMDLTVGALRQVVSVRQYASAADFVDEVTTVPPISRARSGSTTYKPSGAGARNSTLTFSYDGQRRQTELLHRFADGRTIKTVYSAWDSAGRPTALTTAGQSFKYTYDDAGRIMTIAGPGGLQTHTFDVNGNLIREVVAPAGGKLTTQTTTITKTAQVCR